MQSTTGEAPANLVELGRTPEDIRAMLSRRGVPERFLDASWGTWRWRPEITPELRQHLERFRQWRGGPAETFATLTGTTGSGKTHLAAATMRRWYEAGRTDARWVGVSRLFHNLRAAIPTGQTSQIVDRVVGCKLLVLDDLGTERVTDWVFDTLYTIVSSRYDAERPTVVTTNLTLSEIGQRLDARISSRLSEGLAVKLDLPDYRPRMRLSRVGSDGDAG